MSEEVKEQVQEEYEEPMPKRAEVIVAKEHVVAEQIMAGLKRIHRRMV